MDNMTKQLYDESGMTLVEVIAVVVLITLIYVVVSKTVFGGADKAKANINIVKMNKVKDALQQYNIERSTYPAKLDELVKPPANPGQLVMSYAQPDELKDVWGNPYVYIPENNNRSYVLKTLGADGIQGGDGPRQDVEIRP